jgi:cyclophilin family peptidyl-prolyl cis-trans isomerase
LLCVAAVLLAGCGTNQAAAPPPEPTLTPIMSFKHAPPMTINVSHHYTATLDTSEGAIVITLLPRLAPIAVNNFVFLARHHFYDGVIFHRIISTFMIQTGDPTGTGFDGPGYTIKNDPMPRTIKYTPGTVAMANTGRPNSSGSQFFIVTGPDARNLSHTFTVFGRVRSGMGAVYRIARTPVQPSVTNANEYSLPINPPVMKSVTIKESP